LDRLDAADRRAVQAASVLGQRVRPEALRHLMGDAAYDPSRLVSRHLFRPLGEEFLFSHALIQEAIYGALLKTRRRELHARAAAFHGEAEPAARAEHLDRAEAPEAALAYAAAAEAESAAFRFERALRMAARGLAIARTDEERLRLSLLHAELLRDLGHPEEAIGGFRGALELAPGDDLAACRALIGVASCVRLLGGDAEGRQALDRAEPLALALGADRELAAVGYYRGCLDFSAGDVEACLARFEDARAAAVRAGDAEWEARALSGLGDAHYGGGHMHRALEQFRRCGELCRRHGLGRVEVGSIHMCGVTRRYLNELSEALGDLRSAAATAARVGNVRTEMVALTILGECLCDGGDPDGAYEAFDAALAINTTLGNRRYRAYILYELGRTLWHDPRRRGEAAAVLDDALALSRQTGIGFVGARILAAMALAAAGPARQRALAEGEAVLAGGCLAHNHLWFRRDAIEACLAAGDWHEAERHAAVLEDLTRPEPLPWADLFIARGRALAAHGRGERDAALTARLARLREDALRVGLAAALPALDAALGARPGDP
jgi:tetratricopeptide (TPR) repeat protein